MYMNLKKFRPLSIYQIASRLAHMFLEENLTNDLNIFRISFLNLIVIQTLVK